MNSLIEAGRLSEVGMVVADELHMIGDGPRGAIYEMILSKAKFCGRRSNLQIVATTATLENKSVRIWWLLKPGDLINFLRIN